jgi:hypothetical protein
MWESGGIAPQFLTSVRDGNEWLASRPGCFNHRERAPRTHWMGGPQSRSGRCVVKRKTLPLNVSVTHK